MFGTKLSPEEKAAKAARKARERAERARINEAIRVKREAERQERYDAFPEFVVQERREVTVKAANMKDAIALASAAFDHGQEEDHSIDRFDRPWGIEGDTVDEIRTVNIKATEIDD
jgi:hypothetical protein